MLSAGSAIWWGGAFSVVVHLLSDYVSMGRYLHNSQLGLM